jgi:hypothetical protein
MLLTPATLALPCFLSTCSNQARGLLENDPLLTWASRQHALGRAAAGDGGAPPAVSPFADAALPPQPSGGLPSPSGGGSGPLEGGGLAGAGPSGGSSGFNHRLSSGASMVDIKPWCARCARCAVPPFRALACL